MKKLLAKWRLFKRILSSDNYVLVRVTKQSIYIDYNIRIPDLKKGIYLMQEELNDWARGEMAVNEVNNIINGKK